jgi:hypothetical protein
VSATASPLLFLDHACTRQDAGHEDGDWWENFRSDGMTPSEFPVPLPASRHSIAVIPRRTIVISPPLRHNLDEPEASCCGTSVAN